MGRFHIVDSLRGMVLALGFLVLSAPSALAIDENEATSFVQGVVERVVALIENDPTVEGRREEFRVILTDAASMSQIGKFSAGRNWRAMDPAQQERYSTLFVDYIATVYARRFEEYSGEKLEVTGSQDLGDRGIIVKSEVAQQGAQPIRIEWLVSDRSGATRIDDIVIEGVSLAITQREEFAAMVAKNGNNIDAFLADLMALSEI